MSQYECQYQNVKNAWRLHVLVLRHGGRFACTPQPSTDRRTGIRVFPEPVCSVAKQRSLSEIQPAGCQRAILFESVVTEFPWRVKSALPKPTCAAYGRVNSKLEAYQQPNRLSGREDLRVCYIRAVVRCPVRISGGQPAVLRETASSNIS
jgi:hypothetical protein